jgi:hypothetical protein
MVILGAPPLYATNTWNGLMNFQGQLTNSSGIAEPNGSYTMKFALYSVSSGGSSFWSETQTVTVSSGLFDVVLGSSIPLNTLPASDFTQDIWVGVTVNSDAEMSPHQQLLPAVYARNAQALNGLQANNQANNLVVLNASGTIPAGLVADGTVSVPMDLTSSSASYLLSLSSTNASAGALGLTVSAANGIQAQASSAGGYGAWGQTAAADNAGAVGVHGSANAGMGVLAESTNGIGLSATSQSSTQPALAAAGANPVQVLVNSSATNNLGVNVATTSGSQHVYLVDRIDHAGVYSYVTASATYGVEATASAASGVLGVTNSNSPTDYGVWGISNGTGGTGVYGSGITGVAGVTSVNTAVGVVGSNSGTGTTVAGGSTFGNAVGVEGLGYTGVQGQVNQNGGDAVEGDVASAYSGAVGVQGINNNATGVGVGGRHTGTGAGIGVRGSSASGIGAMGVYGQVSGAAAVGVEGYTQDAYSFGVAGVQGSATNLPGDVPATGAGVYGATLFSTGNGVLGAGGSQGDGVLGIGAGVCGVCGNSQSINGGSGGYFQAQGATGTNYGVRAANASPAGVNYFSDVSLGSPAYAFYHYDPTPSQTNAVGVYSESNCNGCQAGVFYNRQATTMDGSALSINGRVQVVGSGSINSAGTFNELTATFPLSSYTFYNSYIPNDGNCLIFLTPSQATSSVAAVTSISAGQATITFTPPLAASINYQYWIIGQ